MHKIEIPEFVLERIRARRDRLNVFESLHGPRTALVVIDLQNAFMQPGMPGEIPFAREIVPNVNLLAGAVRAAGGKVVWVRMTLERGEKRWSVYLDHFSNAAFRDAEMEALTPGRPGHQLYAELEVEAGDLIIDKTRFSAFIQGSSDLDARLRGAGVDTVVVTGTVSNTCCESTARDAMMLDYKTVFVSDANACRTDEEHNTTLANIYRIFGDVLSTQQVVKLLSPQASG
jgi:ureidoacrylate peracid hydrolase